MSLEVLRVLYLEDNLSLALATSQLLGHLGVGEVEVVNTIDDAQSEIESGNYNVAILDIRIGNRLSTSLIKECEDRNIQTVLTSGLATADDGTPDNRVLKKPVGLPQWQSRLSEIAATVEPK